MQKQVSAWKKGLAPDGPTKNDMASPSVNAGDTDVDM